LRVGGWGLRVEGWGLRVEGTHSNTAGVPGIIGLVSCWSDWSCIVHSSEASNAPRLSPDRSN